jgi:hypothetical protein
VAMAGKSSERPPLGAATERRLRRLRGRFVCYSGCGGLLNVCREPRRAMPITSRMEMESPCSRAGHYAINLKRRGSGRV